MITDAGVAGGLIVHLGCGDGTRTAELRIGKSFIVHGLDRNAEHIAAARERLQARKLYGPVSVMQLRGERLPYTDSLVNLIVADDLAGISRDEARRVLCPGGVLIAEVGGKWAKTVKPLSASADEWTHWFHSANGNAVSADVLVGPPRRLRWSAGPHWARSHEMTSSFAAMVSADGRIYYIFDEGQTGIETPVLPEQWMLICRDANNGIVLWKRSLRTWGSAFRRNRALRGLPPSIRRRIVARGDALYVTLDLLGAVHELDGATGAIRRELKGTQGATDLLVDDGGLVCSRVVVDGRKRSTVITNIDLGSGKVRWTTTVPRIQSPCLALHPAAVIYHSGQAVVCLDRHTGEEMWRAPDPTTQGKKGRGGKMLLIAQDAVVIGDGRQIRSLAKASGNQLWAAPSGQGAMRSSDLFYSNGKIWHAVRGGLIAGYDLATGAKTATVDPRSVNSRGHHLRCYRAKATKRFLITQFRGVEFISLEGKPHTQNDWVRGPCTYGVMPANGLLYVPPHPCFCYGGAMMTAFNAYSTASDAALDGIGRAVPYGDLEKGLAFSKPKTENQPPKTSTGWPAYRHDAMRSGATPSGVGAKPAPRWKTSLGGRLSPPVAARGMLYTSVKDEHSVCAIRTEMGDVAWRVYADAPVDSPPAVYQRWVLFGSADGRLYCLDAATGALAWRRRLAPAVRFMLSFGALESVWRVHGSPLIRDGIAYVTAGRSSFLDGGLFIYSIDVATGEIKHRTRYHTLSDTREDAADGDLLPAFSIEGARSDILVSQGGFIYLNQIKFTPDLKLVDSAYLRETDVATVRTMRLDEADYVDRSVFRLAWRGKRYGDSETQASIGVKRGPMGERHTGLHLFTKSGFLDDSWYNRTYWMYSETWPGFQHAILAPKAGQLLVIGKELTIAVKAYNSRYVLSPKYTPGKGHLLIADRNDDEPILDARSWGRDKGMGFTRSRPPVWHRWVPVRVRAMTLAGDTLFIAGPPDVIKEDDPMAAWRGRTDSRLLAFSATSGDSLAKLTTTDTPVFDGMIAADGKLFLVTEQGSVLCFSD